MLRLKQGRALHLALLALGFIALAYSFVATSTILAFIGLGLTFWGALLLYVTNERYVKQDLLPSTSLSSLQTLRQILDDLNYRGTAVYLPPQYFTTSDPKIYVPKDPTTHLPTPHDLQRQGDHIFVPNPEAVLIVPPGLALASLFERTLKTNFITNDLKQLIHDLPKLVIEDLEVAENLEVTLEPLTVHNRSTNSAPPNSASTTLIHIHLTNSIYEDLSKEVVKPSTGYPMYQIGCPIFSALACALAKITGKPITIERILASDDGKTYAATYHVLEPIDLVDVQVEQRPFTPHLQPVSLILTALGAFTLASITWLIWYDITTWGKDLPQILFGSRVGEPMSLGLGVTAFHYVVFGSVLLGFGLLSRHYARLYALRGTRGTYTLGRGVERAESLPLLYRLNPLSLLLTAAGVGALAWIGWLIWYDVTTWGKDLPQILFGSRVGEPMSLGLDLIAFYYLLAGVVLLVLGLLTHQENVMQVLRKTLQSLSESED